MTEGFDRKGFTDRLVALRKKWERQHGEVRDLDLGIAVGQRIGREAYHPTTVYRWFQGDLMPGLDALWGLARFYDANPGWLAFGAASVDDESGDSTKAQHGPPPRSNRKRRAAGDA